MLSNNKIPNRLINEKSPYLLQHAYNPVNWYPWGEEAFQKAKEEDKPVFLSIGYSTCHWCHVMERESFEDDEVASLLNEHFVCVKVDKEERPDIDSVYMAVCQAMTAGGGWPLTIVMSSQQKPFFAETYIPKNSKYSRKGLMELLPEISDLWNEQRKEIEEFSDKLIDFLNKTGSGLSSRIDPEELVKKAISGFKASFDNENGGFGNAPKFPSAHILLFLMDHYQYFGDEECFEIAQKTLTQMYRGGIFDHIGGGFSRYSVDSFWLIPHFEKMSYDNALLICAYSQAYILSGNELYRDAAQMTADYILTEMTNDAGAFYCAQDADGDGIEGKYYVFTPDEIRAVLGDGDAQVFRSLYDITEKGNFEGKSIPNLLKNDEFESADFKTRHMKKALYDYRLKRTRLHKDDKVLTSWNALMITAMCRIYQATDDERYLNAAKRANAFISGKLTDEDGLLLLRYREGESGGDAQLDDYAFYCWSLLEIYGATFDADYLIESIRIAEFMVKLFFDEDNGGFFIYSNESERLISRPKDIYDGAIPSGNSAAFVVFARLFRLTGDVKWNEFFQKQLDFLLPRISSYPMGYAFCLIGMLECIAEPTELVCVSDEDDIEQKLRLLLKRSRRNISSLVKTPENEQKLSEACPFTKFYNIKKGLSLFYLCKNDSCSEVVQDIDNIRESVS